MNLEDCIEAARQAEQVITCGVSIETTGFFSTAVNAGSLIASAAIVITTIYAIFQYEHLKKNYFQSAQQHRDHLENSKTNSRTRATLDILLHQQSNPGWADQRQRFVDLRNHQDGLQKYANQSNQEAMLIRRQLNFYEMIAIGIRSEILDESMYREYYKTTIIRDFDAARRFIELERENGPVGAKFWIWFEDLADGYRKIDEAEAKGKLPV